MSAILLPGGVPRPLPRGSHAPNAAAGRAAPAPAPTLAPPPTTGAARSGLQPPGGGQRSTGLAVVVGVHLLIGWALASGLARDAIEIVIKKPIEMAIITEAPPPPPPPPPPKVEKIVQQVPKVAPPPAYVPPTEVVVAPPPAPVIQAVQHATQRARELGAR